MPSEPIWQHDPTPKVQKSSLAILENIAAHVRSSSASIRYSTGIAITLGFVFLRFLFAPYTGSSLPLLIFYPAVLLAAWLGGIGPGIVSCVICAVAENRFGTLPIYSFSVGAYGGLIAFILFMAIGTMMTGIIDVLGKTRQRLEERSRRLVVESSERARAQAAAEAANRTKDEFLAMASHDLRAPLQGILGAAHALKKQALTDKQLQFVSIIQRNAENQARLLQDLIDMSRISTGHLPLKLEQTNLRSIVEGILESLRASFEEKHLEVIWKVAGPEQPVMADVGRMQQVISNLITNAMKFTHPGGWIRVELNQTRQSDLELTVSDSGIGIEPAFLPQVFTPFRQAKATHRGGGVGLGLAIVKHLVEQHGGTVRVHSEGAGRGCTFTVRLPAERPPVVIEGAVHVDSSR
jgi:signal transduction histidine kinase